MKIIINQEDITYCYKCRKNSCTMCPLRFVCYTNKAIRNEVVLCGTPELDYLVLSAKLMGILNVNPWRRLPRFRLER